MKRDVLFAVVFAAVGVAASAQPSFDDIVKQLSSADAGARLKAVHVLRESAYPEAALPLARAIGDQDDGVQAEAIAAELNIFLARKVVSRRRIGYVIEVRKKIAADAAFSAGEDALGSAAVPPGVLTALLAASRDDNPRIGLEALYAFGTLAPAATGETRVAILRASAPELASMVGAPGPAFRYAALRVIGRTFAGRAGDPATDATLGDAVILALNDRDEAVRRAAMDALGAMRYARALDALTQLFQYFGRGEDAEAALDAIARIGHPSSAPLLAEQLQSKSASARAMAIEGLARAGDRSRDLVGASSVDRDDRVRLAGAFAATRLVNAPIDPIVSALGQPKLSQPAFAYLVELAPGRVKVFARYAQDPNAETRARVVDALGLSGDASAVSVVEPLVKDADPQVASAAARAVARLRGF